MKNLLLFVFLLLLATQAFSQTEKADAEAVVTRFFDGIAELDNAKMRSQVSADFALLEDGHIWTLDSLISILEPLKQENFKRENQLRFVRTDVQGNLAYTYYHNTANMSFGDKKGTMNWLESAVLRKEKGQWKLVLLHSTVKPK